MSLLLPKPLKRFKVPKFIRRKLPINHRRVAAKANGDLTREQWIEILRAYRFNCAYVPPSGKHFGMIVQDHIKAIARGGGHTAANVAPACERCNFVKGVQTWRVKPGHPFRKDS